MLPFYFWDAKIYVDIVIMLLLDIIYLGIEQYY